MLVNWDICKPFVLWFYSNVCHLIAILINLCWLYTHLSISAFVVLKKMGVKSYLCSFQNCEDDFSPNGISFKIYLSYRMCFPTLPFFGLCPWNLYPLLPPGTAEVPTRNYKSLPSRWRIAGIVLLKSSLGESWLFTAVWFILIYIYFWHLSHHMLEKEKTKSGSFNQLICFWLKFICSF